MSETETETRAKTVTVGWRSALGGLLLILGALTASMKVIDHFYVSTANAKTAKEKADEVNKVQDKNLLTHEKIVGHPVIVERDKARQKEIDLIKAQMSILVTNSIRTAEQVGVPRWRIERVPDETPNP